MFGDMEGLTRLDVSQPEQDFGVLECWVEMRSEDWWITYKVYENNVEVIESMGDVMDHCFKTCDTLDEAISVVSQWC